MKTKIFLWVSTIVGVVLYLIGLVGIFRYTPQGQPLTPPDLQVAAGVLAMFAGLCVFLIMVVHIARAQE